MPYCAQCWEENDSRCYACAVITGDVDDVKTRFDAAASMPVVAEDDDDANDDGRKAKAD